MKDIQTFPLGLQGLLQVKGQLSPLGLEDNVRLVIESFPFFAVQRQENVIFAPIVAPANGTNFFSDGTVPAGETWYVWQYTLTGTTGVADSLNLTPAISWATSSFAVGNKQAIAVSERFKQRAECPIIVTAGQIFGMDIGRLAGVAFTIVGQALVTKLKT